jgi:hypothetical protein
MQLIYDMKKHYIIDEQGRPANYPPAAVSNFQTSFKLPSIALYPPITYTHALSMS